MLSMLLCVRGFRSEHLAHLVTFAIASFASWTVTVHAVSLTGKSFIVLVRLLVPMFVPLAISSCIITEVFDAKDKIAKRQKSSVDGVSIKISISKMFNLHEFHGFEKRKYMYQRLLLVLGGLAMGMFLFNSTLPINIVVALWSFSFLSFGLSYIILLEQNCCTYEDELQQSTLRESVSNSPSNRYLFIFAAISASFLSLKYSKADDDDCLYLNIAVSAINAPNSPVPQFHGIFGMSADEGFGIIPTYRLHAYELFIAIIAYVFGFEPIFVAQKVMPPLLSFLCTGSAAMLFQIISPARWGRITLFWVSSIHLLRGTPRQWGSFGFVRMFQGKSAFVSGGVPAIMAYSILFCRESSFRSWLKLVIAQVASVGFTANAVYVAPIVATFSLAACWDGSVRGLKNVFLGMSSSFYLIAVGFVVRGMVHKYGYETNALFDEMSLSLAIREVFGSFGARSMLIFLFMTYTWTIVHEQLWKQFFLAYLLGFLGTCLNPVLIHFWQYHVTARYLFWRLFWTLPLPVMVAVGCESFFDSACVSISKKFVLSRKCRRIFVLLAAVVVLTLGLDETLCRTSYRSATARISMNEKLLQQSRDITALVGGGSPVLVPENIAAKLPMSLHHAIPIASRIHYMKAMRDAWNKTKPTLSRQADERLQLIKLVSKPIVDDVQAFHHSVKLLESYVMDNRLDAIGVYPDSIPRRQLTSITKYAMKGMLIMHQLEDLILYARVEPGIFRSDMNRLQESFSTAEDMLIDSISTNGGVSRTIKSRTTDGAFNTTTIENIENNTWVGPVVLDVLSSSQHFGDKLTELIHALRLEVFRQIKDDGLVTYNNYGNLPPDCDDTALSFLAVEDMLKHDTIQRGMKKMRYNMKGGLYQTWIFHSNRTHRIMEKNAIDTLVNLHVNMALSSFGTESEWKRHFERIRDTAKEHRNDVWNYLAPFFPFFRQIQYRYFGLPFHWSSDLLNQFDCVSKQNVYKRMLAVWQELMIEDEGLSNGRNSTCQKAADFLLETSASNFSLFRFYPLLMYHNDLTLPTEMYYWSSDVPLSFWLAIYFYLTKSGNCSHEARHHIS